MYDESLRVPLVVRYPPLVPRGRSSIKWSSTSTWLQHPRHLRRQGVERHRRPIVEAVAGRQDPRLAGVVPLLLQLREGIPLHAQCAGIRTATGSTSTTPTGTAARIATRWSFTTWRPTPGAAQPHCRPDAAGKLAELQKEHSRLMRRHKAVPDHMPVDGGIINVLPKF